MQPIYLDHNATTPMHPAVAEAMAECHRAGYRNPASQHQFGRTARRELENAREQIARFLGADPNSDRLVFTSGGTEANNLAILGLGKPGSGNVVMSAIEHPSAIGAAERLSQLGTEVRKCPVTQDGVVDLDRLNKLIDGQTSFVSVMLGNNETGVIQPVKEIAAICRQRQMAFHTDAVQAVGKVRVNFRDLGPTAMTISAHKFHGPSGIGALLIRGDAEVKPLLFGGFQQGGTRPGTEPIALAVGMSRALELWKNEAEECQARMRQLRDTFEERLRAAIPDLVVNGGAVPRLPHTSNCSFPGRDRQALLMAFDMAGVACSTGSACASGSSEPSPVLLAMGCPKTVVDGSLRFSLGAGTTLAEVREAADRIIRIVNEL